MFKLHDIRKTRVWKEDYEEDYKRGFEQGFKKGIEQGRALEKQEIVARLQARGQTLKEIALLLDISLAEVRRLVGR